MKRYYPSGRPMELTTKEFIAERMAIAIEKRNKKQLEVNKILNKKKK